MITNRLPSATDDEIGEVFNILVPTAPDWIERAQPWWGADEYPWAETYEEAQAQVDDTFFCFDAERGEGLPIIEKYAEEIYKVSGMLYGYDGIWELFGNSEEYGHEYEGLRDFFYDHADEFPTFVKAFKLADQTQKDIYIYEGNC